MAFCDQAQSSTDKMKGRTRPGCSPCSDDGTYKPAGHYCVECELYFCDKCVTCHNKIPTLTDHQVNVVVAATFDLTSVTNETEERSVRSTEPLKCGLHHNQCIDTYCTNHDEVCCGTCVIVKHRSCSTEAISIVAEDFKSSPAFKESKDQLNSLVNRLREQNEKQTHNLESVDQEKIECLEAIDNYEEEVVAKIRQLANNSRREIRSKYEEHKTAIEGDIAAVNGVLETIGKYVETLDKADMEQLAFVNVINSKIALQDGKQFLETMIADWEERTIRFNINETLRQTLHELQCIGQLGKSFHVKEYKAKFVKKINVSHSGDISISNVKDICVMNSGDVIVTAFNNYKIRRFSSDLQFKDEIKFQSEPKAVCKISHNEVAVRTGSMEFQIHVVYVNDKMQPTSTLKLDWSFGEGIAYNANTGEMLVCEGDKVGVYSKTGQKIGKYDKDTRGEKIFSECRQIALSENNQDLYVTDKDKGLIVLDKNGALKMRVPISDIGEAWPLCLLPKGICLVGGEKQCIFKQIDKHGNSYGNIIEKRDGPQYTYCASYDRENARLLVGGSDNTLLVYELTITT